MRRDTRSALRPGARGPRAGRVVLGVGLGALLCAGGLSCAVDGRVDHRPAGPGRSPAEAPSPATVELRLVVATVAQPEFVALEVRPAWGGLNSGPRRDYGWRRLPVVTRLGRLGVDGPRSRPVALARGPIAAGTYDRVFVAVPEVVAVTRDAERRALRSHVEPIALRVTVPPSGSVRVDIELAVLPGASGGDGQPEVFVRNARVVSGETDPSLAARGTHGSS